MESNKVQAQFQLLDSYVKEFSIQTIKKIETKEELNINGQLGFRILNIREENNNFIGQIELINDIKVNVQEEEKTLIHMSMVGLFAGSTDYDKTQFEELLKINGATTLSHLIRAYIYSITGLSGMPQIVTPMVNFIEFFNDEKK